MTTEKGIWIITDETAVEDVTRGGKDSYDTGADYSGKSEVLPRKRRTRISADDLKGNMAEFLDVMEETFEKAEKTQSKMQLEEIELAVEINGKGQVSLLGTGGEMGGKAAITLKFKRKS